MRERGHITHVDSPYIVPRSDKSALGDMNMQRQLVWLVLACVQPPSRPLSLPSCTVYPPTSHQPMMPRSKQKNKPNEPQHHVIKRVLLSTKKCSSAFLQNKLKNWGSSIFFYIKKCVLSLLGIKRLSRLLFVEMGLFYLSIYLMMDPSTG